MKKPFRHDELSSDFRCIDCGNRIKKNLVIRKEVGPFRCYGCHMLHLTQKGKKSRRVPIIYKYIQRQSL